MVLSKAQKIQECLYLTQDRLRYFFMLIIAILGIVFCSVFISIGAPSFYFYIPDYCNSYPPENSCDIYADNIRCIRCKEKREEEIFKKDEHKKEIENYENIKLPGLIIGLVLSILFIIYIFMAMFQYYEANEKKMEKLGCWNIPEFIVAYEARKAADAARRRTYY